MLKNAALLLQHSVYSLTISFCLSTKYQEEIGTLHAQQQWSLFTQKNFLLIAHPNIHIGTGFNERLDEHLIAHCLVQHRLAILVGRVHVDTAADQRPHAVYVSCLVHLVHFARVVLRQRHCLFRIQSTAVMHPTIDEMFRKLLRKSLCIKVRRATVFERGFNDSTFLYASNVTICRQT